MSISVILLLSLLIIFSIGQAFFINQVISIVLGLFLYFFISNFDYRVFKRFDLIFLVISVFLLLLTFILGRITRGSVRWIQIGPLAFQSSEFVKPLLIISFSSLALKLDFSKIKEILIYFSLLLIPDFLIFKQPDLGNSIVVLVIGLTIIFATGIRMIYVLTAFIILFLTMPMFWRFLKPYQQQRIVSFINPDFDPLGSGYHILQSTITVGSGGLIGKGLGSGTQSQLRFLPESHTDFIFASFAEELGFLGASLLMVCYFILLLRILTYARRAADKFGFLVCLGVFMMFFFQTFVNIGMNLGLLPITGITLPLFSVGGSSLVTTLISLGLVQSIGRNLKREKTIEIG